jgi:hypothetical protein
MSMASAHAEDACAKGRAKMGRVIGQYSGMVEQLRAARRELGSFSRVGEEAALRAVRQFGLVQRNLDGQRNRVLEVYEQLVAGRCESFDREGYDRTLTDFRRISDEERETLADARRRSSNPPVEAN